MKAFQARLCLSVQCRFAKTPDAHPSLLLHPPFRSQSKPNDARARARAWPAFKGIFISSIASNNQNTTERRCLKFKVMLLRGTGKLRRKFCFAAAVVLLQRGVAPQLHLYGLHYSAAELTGGKLGLVLAMSMLVALCCIVCRGYTPCCVAG